MRHYEALRIRRQDAELLPLSHSRVISWVDNHVAGSNTYSLSTSRSLIPGFPSVYLPSFSSAHLTKPPRGRREQCTGWKDCTFNSGI